MITELQSEIDQFGFEFACNNFCEKAKFLTKASATFFLKLQLSSSNSEQFIEEDVIFNDLYIQDHTNISKQKIPLKKNEKVTLTLTSEIDSCNRPYFENKKLVITNLIPVTILKATRAFTEMPNNLFFKAKSVGDIHAELWLQDSIVYIRDLGTISGTQINNFKFTRAGFASTPRPLYNNYILKIRAISMTINVIPLEKITNSKQVLITTHQMIDLCLNDGSKKTISLLRGQSIFVGKSTMLDPRSQPAYKCKI